MIWPVEGGLRARCCKAREAAHGLELGLRLLQRGELLGERLDWRGVGGGAPGALRLPRGRRLVGGRLAAEQLLEVGLLLGLAEGLERRQRVGDLLVRRLRLLQAWGRGWEVSWR